MDARDLTNTYHYPECRKKMMICNKAVYLPLGVTCLNILVGTLIIIFSGGLTMDNYMTMELFAKLIFWSIATGVPSLLVMAGFKAQCIVSCIAYMLMTAFIGNAILMVISFLGVIVSVVALYYIAEREDLSKLPGYPDFIVEDYEYLRPTSMKENITDEESEKSGGEDFTAEKNNNNG